MGLLFRGRRMSFLPFLIKACWWLIYSFFRLSSEPHSPFFLLFRQPRFCSLVVIRSSKGLRHRWLFPNSHQHFLAYIFFFFLFFSSFVFFSHFTELKADPTVRDLISNLIFLFWNGEKLYWQYFNHQQEQQEQQQGRKQICIYVYEAIGYIGLYIQSKR